MKDDLTEKHRHIDALLRSCGEDARAHFPGDSSALLEARKAQAVRAAVAALQDKRSFTLPGLAWLGMPRVAAAGALAACIALLLVRAPQTSISGNQITLPQQQSSGKSAEYAPSDRSAEQVAAVTVETAGMFDGGQLVNQDDDASLAADESAIDDAREGDTSSFEDALTLEEEEAETEVADDAFSSDALDTYLTNATGDDDDDDEADFA